MRKVFVICLILLLLGGAVWLSEQGPTMAVQGALHAPAPGTPAPFPAAPPTPAAPSLIALIQGQLDTSATAVSARATAQEAGRAANAYIAAQTAEALAWQRTQESARATAAQAVVQATASAQAAAGATATGQAWTIIGWTATADAARSTSEARRQETADALHLASALRDARQTEVAATHVAVTLRQAQDRQEAINQVMAWAPYGLYLLVALSLIGVLTLAAIRLYHAPQAIHPNKNGELPMLMDRNGNWLLPARSPIAAGRFGGAAGVQGAPLADSDVQERVIMREQAVAIAVHGQPGAVQPPRAERPEGPVGMPLPVQSNFRIFGPAETPQPLVQDPDALRVLDAQWREESA